jgi:glycosyltransferase involved in cell wall biosynthesis
MRQTRRIVFVANSLRDTWRFRGHLIQTLVRGGVDTWIIAPVDGDRDAVERTGVKVRPWPFRRDGSNPLMELGVVAGLARTYRALGPDLVHQFTAKPILYGTIAAQWTRPRPVIVSTLTGLGHLFVDGRASAVRGLVRRGLRWSVRRSDAFTFLNEADPRVLGVETDPRVRVIAGGEGVDERYFSPGSVGETQLAALRRGLGIEPDSAVVTMVARLIADKGVREFVNAARAVGARRARTRFLLVGATDHENPAGIRASELEAWTREGCVMVLGPRRDVRELMAMSDLVTLPSWYGEGAPMVLMEAAALGKPLVATAIPGCRVVAHEGVNALIVPPRDVAALSGAIDRLLGDPDLRERFGHASRRLATETLSVRRVVPQVLRLYERLGVLPPSWPDGIHDRWTAALPMAHAAVAHDAPHVHSGE